jgi:hypothetical protein
VIYFDEDGPAEFDGEAGLIPYVDGGGSSTDVVVALEDGDIGWYVGGGGVEGEVVGCGGSTCAGTWIVLAIVYTRVMKLRGPMIATRLAGGGLLPVSASASGSSAVRWSKRTIFAVQGAAMVRVLQDRLLDMRGVVGRRQKRCASSRVVHGAARVLECGGKLTKHYCTPLFKLLMATHIKHNASISIDWVIQSPSTSIIDII